MSKYRFEAILAVVLIALFFGVSSFQSASKLTKAEVDDYVSIMERDLPKEMEDRAEFIARLRDWGMNDDGKPIYMLNVMRFFDKLHPIPGALSTGTPKEANAVYEDAAKPLLFKRGAYPIIAGDTTRLRGKGKLESNILVYQKELDNWDRVLVVRYPGRRSFIGLMANPEYLKAMPNKLASLEVVLTPVSGDLVIPDLRWVAGGIFLATFLLVGWIRAARRGKQ